MTPEPEKMKTHHCFRVLSKLFFVISGLKESGFYCTTRNHLGALADGNGLFIGGSQAGPASLTSTKAGSYSVRHVSS